MKPDMTIIAALAETAARGARRGPPPEGLLNPAGEANFALTQEAYLPLPVGVARPSAPLVTTYDARCGLVLPKHCPACHGRELLYLGGIACDAFARRLVPVHFCPACGTLATFHNQTRARLDPAISWHRSVEARNRAHAPRLLDELRAIRPQRAIRRVVEIGCGPGWLLDEWRRHPRGGVNGTGFESNPFCAAHGQNLGLDIRARAFRPEDATGADALVCLSVLEHLEDPDALLRSLATAARETGALVCLSVPLYGGAFLRFCGNTRERVPANPFWLVPAHVTHFTQAGFAALIQRHGGRLLGLLRQNGLWSATVCTFSRETP